MIKGRESGIGLAAAKTSDKATPKLGRAPGNTLT